MINFSRVGLKSDLIAAINALSALPDESVDAEDLGLAKSAAIAKIERLKTTGAHVNLRVNSISQWSQTEIQVAGQNITVKAPTGPVAPPANDSSALPSAAKALAILIAFLMLSLSAFAQQQPWPTSGTTVYGTSNTPAMDTNTPSLNVKQLQGFQISNITNTSGSYTSTVWKSFSPTSLVGAIQVGQIVFTGASSFSSNNIPALKTNPPVYTIFQASCGTNTATWNFLYGP